MNAVKLNPTYQLTKVKINLSTKAMIIANKMMKGYASTEKSTIFKKAWKFVKIRTKAKANPVMVEFTKKNGSIRKGLVTTNMDLIPKKFHPKGTGSPSTNTYWKCFDIINQKWISFHATQINL